MDTRPFEISARLEDWDGIDPLTPLQVAYLWFELEPQTSGRATPERVRAKASQLADYFEIPVCSYVDETLAKEIEPKLTRAQLKHYSQRRGAIPKFLLSPEERGSVDEKACPLTTPQKMHGNTERYAANREQVLGAALACLAQRPDRCRSKDGKVVAAKLRLIDDKAPLFWPERREPPLKPAPIEDVIRGWLKKTAD